MTKRWDAARAASNRPLPKPHKMHGPIGPKTHTGNPDNADYGTHECGHHAYSCGCPAGIERNAHHTAVERQCSLSEATGVMVQANTAITIARYDSLSNMLRVPRAELLRGEWTAERVREFVEIAKRPPASISPETRAKWLDTSPPKGGPLTREKVVEALGTLLKPNHTVTPTHTASCGCSFLSDDAAGAAFGYFGSERVREEARAAGWSKLPLGCGYHIARCAREYCGMPLSVHPKYPAYLNRVDLDASLAEGTITRSHYAECVRLLSERTPRGDFDDKTEPCGTLPKALHKFISDKALEMTMHAYHMEMLFGLETEFVPGDEPLTLKATYKPIPAPEPRAGYADSWDMLAISSAISEAESSMAKWMLPPPTFVPRIEWNTPDFTGKVDESALTPEQWRAAGRRFGKTETLFELVREKAEREARMKAMQESPSALVDALNPSLGLWKKAYEAYYGVDLAKKGAGDVVVSKVDAGRGVVELRRVGSTDFCVKHAGRQHECDCNHTIDFDALACGKPIAAMPDAKFQLTQPYRTMHITGIDITPPVEGSPEWAVKRMKAGDEVSHPSSASRWRWIEHEKKFEVLGIDGRWRHRGLTDFDLPDRMPMSLQTDEWLVVEPAKPVAKNLSDHVHEHIRLLEACKPFPVLPGIEHGQTYHNPLTWQEARDAMRLEGVCVERNYHAWRYNPEARGFECCYAGPEPHRRWWFMDTEFSMTSTDERRTYVRCEAPL